MGNIFFRFFSTTLESGIMGRRWGFWTPFIHNFLFFSQFFLFLLLLLIMMFRHEIDHARLDQGYHLFSSWLGKFHSLTLQLPAAHMTHTFDPLFPLFSSPTPWLLPPSKKQDFNNIVKCLVRIETFSSHSQISFCHQHFLLPLKSQHLADHQLWIWFVAGW